MNRFDELQFFDQVNTIKKQARLCYMISLRITNPALYSDFSKYHAWRSYREDSLWSSPLLSYQHYHHRTWSS